MVRIIISMMMIVQTAIAAEWHSSPSATGGTGAFADPWHLQIALTNASVLPGDTLYLRGTNIGTFSGNYFSKLRGNPGNQIVVKSYPGEWAKLDGVSMGTLLTSIASNNAATLSDIPIANSEFWQFGQVVGIDSEQFQLNARNSTITNWNLVRGWNGTGTNAHSSGASVLLRADTLFHTGTNVTFRDFEITSSLSTNRVTGSNWYVSSGVNLDTGYSNNLINLVIHNTGHPGIGWWDQRGGEVHGCIVWGVGHYDQNGTHTAGSGLYGQNVGAMVRLKNNIAFRNFTTGMKLFGETGPARDAEFLTNIFFNAGSVAPTEVSSGSTPTSNVWFNGNVIMGVPLLAYESPTNYKQFFINNTVVNGAIQTKNHQDSVYTNNLVLMPATNGTGGTVNSYLGTTYPTSTFNVVWNRNWYYMGTNSSPYNWTFKSLENPTTTNAAGGGNLKFTNDSGVAWQDWSGFDRDTVWKGDGWPTNIQQVIAVQNDYDGRWVNVSIVNTDPNTTNATLSLSSFGYVSGQQYILRDAQNYFSPITTGTWSGAAINVPLNRTNVSTISGTITHYTNEHTNVDYPGLFNAFVLERQGLSMAGSVNAMAGSGRSKPKRLALR